MSFKVDCGAFGVPERSSGRVLRRETPPERHMGDLPTLKSEFATLKAQLSLRIYLMAGLVVAALKFLEHLNI